MSTEEKKAEYHPNIFDPKDMTDARKLSVPDYPEGLKSDERWERETKFLLDKITAELSLAPGMWVLDYGCGVGRLAKPLCENGVYVIGVDQSAEMRKYAAEYVNDPKHFLCISPEMLAELVKAGLRVDGAYSVWCIYHCPDPNAIYIAIRMAMKFNAKFFNVNSKDKRFIPTLAPEFRWIEDSVNVWRIAESYFGLCNTIVFPIELDPKNQFIARTYIRTTVADDKD